LACLIFSDKNDELKIKMHEKFEAHIGDDDGPK